MNQRVSVRAIIQKDAKTLLLRRTTGRPSMIGKYELPGGTIDIGEQPEISLSRYLKDDANITVKSVQLFDVMTYIDHDDRNIQYTFILYIVSILNIKQKLALSKNYDHYHWKAMSEMHQYQLTESTKLLLGISQQHMSVEDSNVRQIPHTTVTEKDMSHVVIYSDGGSRGNPGPSASGFVIMNNIDTVINQGGMYLGITTNNQAEYHGVRLGLEKALEIGARTVDVRIDSLLVVNQMNGLYKIKNRELWPINERIRELVEKFEKVTFRHVRREFNQLADGMVNKILNAHASEK